MPIFFPHAKLAEVLGETKIHSNATTIQDLLDEIRIRVPKAQQEKLFRVNILVNGQNIHQIKGRRTQLQENDQVWMIVPSGGG